MAKAKPKTLSGTVSINLDKDAAALTIDKGTVTLTANEIEVIDDDSAAAAGAMIATCGNRIKAIEEFFEDDKSMANRLHKSICAKIALLCAPYSEARTKLEDKLRPFRQAQKVKVAELSAALTADAEDEKSQMLAQAKKLRKQGRIEEARELERQAELIVAPIVPSFGMEVPGLSEREPWKAEVVSIMDLVVAVAEGRVPLMHKVPMRGGGEEEIPILEASPKVLAHLARTLRKDMALPGVRAEQGLSFAVREA
jgi:hypothetical protein